MEMLMRYRYIPFNGGPRLCVGQQFALTEMAYTITRILQTYERIENRMPAPPKYQTDIVLQPADGVQIAFYKGEKA
jgi:cytochrome P450